MAEGIREWRIATLAKELVGRTLQEFTRTRQPAVLEEASSAFARITAGAYERVLQDDWTMLRTPGIPPGLRDNPLVCRPHEVDYDLPSQLADAAHVAPTDDGGAAAQEVTQALDERLSWGE